MKSQQRKSYRKILMGMFAVITLSFVSYAYATANTVFSASDMKAKNSEIADLQTEIAELEVEYFAMMNGVSIHEAKEYGLKEAPAVEYATIQKKTNVAYNR